MINIRADGRFARAVEHRRCSGAAAGGYCPVSNRDAVSGFMHLPAPAARGYVQASAVSSGKEQPMTETSRHDAWQAGDSYDSYMGRWSRPIATRFLAGLRAEERRGGTGGVSR